jgi:hypothetical protein
MSFFKKMAAEFENLGIGKDKDKKEEEEQHHAPASQDHSGISEPITTAIGILTDRHTRN